MTIGDNEYRPSQNLFQSGNGIGFATPSAINRRFRPRRSGLVYDISLRDQSPLPNCLPSDKGESDTEQVIQRKRRKLAGDGGRSSHGKSDSVKVNYRLFVCIKLSPDKLAKLPGFQSGEGSSCTEQNRTNVSSQLSSATVKTIAAGRQRCRAKYTQSHEGLTKRYSELKKEHDSELAKRDDEIRHLKDSLQEHTVLLIEAKRKRQNAQRRNERYEAVRLENANLWKMKADCDNARISQDQQHKEQLDSLYERERQLCESLAKSSDELRLLRQRDELQVKEIEKLVHTDAHCSNCECPALKESQECIAELKRERMSLMKARDVTYLEKMDAVEKAELVEVKFRNLAKERSWWEQKYRSLLVQPPTPSLSHLGLTKKRSEVDSTKSPLLSPPKT